MPSPSHVRSLAVASVLIAAVSSMGAVRASAADASVPTEPVADQTVPIVLDRPGGGVLAFTGAVRDARPVAYPDRAAAERAGLTQFDIESAHNGFFRLRVARTTTCLDLLPGALLHSRPTENGCQVASGLWDVVDGKLTSASGSVLTDVLHDAAGEPSVAAATDPGLGAATGITVQRAGAVGAAAAEFTTPTDADVPVLASGRIQQGERVLVTDRSGNDVGVGEWEPEGRWRAVVQRRDSRGGPLDVLVSVVRDGAVTARSWHTIPYGAAVTADRTSIPRGTVEVTGRGEPDARIVARDGASGSSRVSGDGSWRLRLSVTAEVGRAATIEQLGAGGARSSVSLRVAASDTALPDARIVFPADATESAYVEGDTEPARAIEVRDQADEVVGTGTADRTGHYEIDVPAPDRGGEASFTVVERDGAEQAAAGTFTADYGAPVVITSPTDGADVGDRITVRGTGEPGAEVAVSIGVDPVHAIVGADGAWEAEIGDGAVKPFALTSPASVTYTARSRPAITGTGTPGATVRFQPRGAQDASLQFDTTVRSDGTWRIDGDDLPLPDLRNHAAALIQGPGTPGAPVLDIALEADVRRLEVTAPAAGSVVRTADGDVTITGTGTPGDVVSVVANGVLLPRNTTVSSTGTWRMTQRFGVGSYDLRFASLASGPPVTLSVTVQDEIGVVGPLVVAAPLPGSTVVAENGILFTGTSTPGSRVDLRFDTATGVAASGVADANGRWTIRASRIPFGDVTVYAVNPGAAPIRFGITVR